ncbi:SRPBCC family protein [Kineococcus sp. SYSU DK005]|uniref:SRPBCC family protein n=1 Tax=Kineococcus sp. SYSU DK005 TaxID=3383126 RepID=UPI003D7EB88E
MGLLLVARGPRDAGAAWEDYAVPARWPSWSPQVTGVRACAPRIAAGVRGAVRAPLGVRVPFEVTAVDEAARTWCWQVGAGPLRAELEHRVLAVPGGSVTELRLSPALLCAPYAPLAQLALRRLVGARPGARAVERFSAGGSPTARRRWPRRR